MKFRDRLIKAEFWGDSFFFRLPAPQRLLFIGVLGLAEDSGCLEFDSLLLKCQLFGGPGDAEITPELIEQWKNQLVEAGRLIPYQAGGKEYLFVKNFHKYQILKHYSAPTTPLPPWLKFIPGEKNPRQGSYEVDETLAVSSVGQVVLQIPYNRTDCPTIPPNTIQINTNQIKLKEAPQIPEGFSELVPCLDKLKGLPSNSKLDPAKILNYLKGLIEEKPEIKRLDLGEEFSKMYAWAFGHPEWKLNPSSLRNWLLRSLENPRKEVKQNESQQNIYSPVPKY